jgi:hypothetical protein
MAASSVGELLAAVDRALAGDWQAAHAVAQEHEGETLADWLHAVAHRMEGDVANARYWYRRCGREPRESSFEPELREIRAALDSLASGGSVRA